MSALMKQDKSNSHHIEDNEYDESWVQKLLQECEHASETATLCDEELNKIELLHDDIIQIENREITPSAQLHRPRSSKKTTVPASCIKLSAIGIQINNMKANKHKSNVHVSSKNIKNAKGLRALLRI